MKNIFLLLAFSCISLLVSAQKSVVQKKNIVIQKSDIERQVFRNATLQMKPNVDFYTRTGTIDLILANEAGEQQLVFSTLPFSDCGGPGYMTNWKEFNTYQKAELKHTDEISAVISEIECLYKERTRSDEKRQVAIDAEMGVLRGREVLLRSDERFTEEKRVNQEWVFDLTFDRLTNEFLDGWEVSKVFEEYASTYMKYDYINEELMIQVGTVGSFFQLTK